MNSYLRIATPLAAVALAGVASAGDVLVSTNITGPGVTTWTANNCYNLQGQVFVESGATLVIEAGTIIASDGGGALAVSRGGQIFANGTKEEPILFTSAVDRGTWTVDKPLGEWREALSEWGNLTIMGNGYISEDQVDTNDQFPAASNVAAMEGLVEAFAGDPAVRYGGGDDDDNSGSLNYVNFRYGGKVIGLNNELNGLSLGGLGRGTDISFIEIMNNVDDGIEIWGGCVNVKNFSIWNIGDDSFDVDQGWRGKAQFGLIVQGWSGDTSQGGGVGDNCFEVDGAENCNWQPVTSATIYNCTIVGQPFDGDHGMAFRDNARVQYRNMLVMDVGADVIQNDGDDGDGSCGYGGKEITDPAGSEAETFDELWGESYDDYYSAVNPWSWDASLNPASGFYQAQTDGEKIEFKDSVLWNNEITMSLGDSPESIDTCCDNVVATTAPIRGITRDAIVFKGGKLMAQVVDLDPRAAGDALTSVATAPADGFFTPANYRGAFDGTTNWLWGWASSSVFGFCDVEGSQAIRNSAIAPNPAAFELGTSVPVVGGVWDPVINHASFPVGTVAIADFVAIGAQATDIPVGGSFGTVLCGLSPFLIATASAPGAPFTLPIPDAVGNIGLEVTAQGGSVGANLSIQLANAIDITVGGGL